MINRAKLNMIQRIRLEFSLWQNKFAGYLSEREQALSAARKKLYFFIFVGVCGSYFIWVILTGFNRQSMQGLHFGNIHASKIPETSHTGNLTLREVRVLNYINYLDSLKRSPSGRVKYESIIKKNPGLKDTLLFIKSQILPTNQ